MNKSINSRFIRVNKTLARNLFCNGQNVYIIPCHCRPETVHQYYPLVKINGDDFDEFVNRYEYYNCHNYRTGMYCAFYIEGMI